MNVIFIGESEENFLLLKTVKSNVIWEKREDFLQKIANNTVLFLEKKAI